MSYLSPIDCENTWLNFENILKKIARRDELGNFWAGVHGLSTYYSCDEYKAIYDYFTVKPDAVRSAIYDTCVCALVAGGYWQRMDLFRLYANHNAGADALMNWIAPGTFGATAFNAPIHTVDQGYLFNGTNQYNDNNWVPSVSGINYLQDNASQIYYIRIDANSTANAHGILNCADTKDAWLLPRHSTTDKSYIRSNSPTNAASAAIVTDGRGLYFNTRTAAAIHKLYRNGAPIIDGVTNSVGVPTHSPYTGASNTDNVATGFRADQVAIEIWMDGCSQADVTAITAILNALMTNLGTNVF